MKKRSHFFALTICTICIFLFLACKEEEPAHNLPILRIVQLCDPQLGFGGFVNDVINLEKAIAQINDLEPDMVLIAGDMVHGIYQEEAISTILSLIAKINASVMLTPGNHDMPLPVTDSALQFYRRHFGEDFNVVECKGRCIISANSVLWCYEASAEEIMRHDNRLFNALSKAKNNAQSIIMLTHIPPFTSSVNEDEEYFNIPKAKRKELLDVCEKNGVILWLAGHTHTTLRNTYKGITLLNGETTSRNFDGNPLGFRLLTIHPDNSFDWDFYPLN
jgi:3',5'-cyclic AMP phosphodiesterase CpdA